jgi:hypothetical protein
VGCNGLEEGHCELRNQEKDHDGPECLLFVEEQVIENEQTGNEDYLCNDVEGDEIRGQGVGGKRCLLFVAGKNWKV